MPVPTTSKLCRPFCLKPLETGRLCCHTLNLGKSEGFDEIDRFLANNRTKDKTKKMSEGNDNIDVFVVCEISGQKYVHYDFSTLSKSRNDLGYLLPDYKVF